MPGSILGTAVTRVEDPELLLGQGTFVDNLVVDGMLHLVFVRSPMAHARIESIDVTEAAAQPGVVAVLTAADLGLAPHFGFAVLNEACGRPPLAEGKVRFVGDCVAAVVAESREAAVDAAESVIVEYDPLPAVTDPEGALAPDAPRQFEALGSNIAAGFRDGRGNPLDGNGAEVVVKGRFVNQRIAVVPMEGNAIAVIPPRPAPEGAPTPDEPLTVYVSTQMPHVLRDAVATTFDLEPADVRVVAPHVGGGFGGKAGLTAEHTVVIAAARRLGRPIKWIEARSENMVAMPHGRGQVQYVELACTRAGVITGLRCHVVGDAGAYAGFGGALAMGPTRFMSQGVYRIPAISYSVAVALTNTTPMGAFRGAGRPEAAAMLERIMDMAAAELGIDPVDMRRRNLLTADQFPLTTVTKMPYDSGDYDRALTEALRMAGYDELRKEQADRRTRGDVKQLGIGVGVYVEITAGGQSSEFGAVEVHEDGTATIRVGTSAHGQGHATSFAMVVSDRLGIPMDAIRFVQSDTAEVRSGFGTGGSRSLQMGGTAVLRAAEGVLEKARHVVAEALEAGVEDIVLTDDGRLGVAGVPARALSWAQVAAAASTQGERLAIELDSEQPGPTFPFGAHVAVVEIDMETGAVTPVRHVAVDDCGRILNPMIVTGQQHGGIAQGMAQALWEQVVYDADGNPLTTTLADYAMPSAADLPSFETANTETPTPHNPLGAKGIGESGTIGALASVHNAVIDGLSHLGVRHLDMPCTPERVWRAMQDARAGTLPSPWHDPPAAFNDLPTRGRAPATQAEQVEV
ncbi:MAG: aerobic carbon-monoxide dehydrogenase large subunit [Acidimicrobiaceae bacterium]|jgi:carbon-monoxide dehydrogenase large subunit|nr:aerobic carbon-monoxide dehydrogenase large subunit [Acidimicrobiaceae bacterium]